MNEETLPVLNDDGAVFHLMRRVLQQHTARWTAALPHMTKTQWAVLCAVAAEPDNDQHLIGERTAIDKATLVPMIARLVDRGWLTCETTRRDRRRKRLTLTADGQAVLDGAASAVTHVDGDALAPITPAERTALRETLARLACPGRSAPAR